MSEDYGLETFDAQGSLTLTTNTATLLPVEVINIILPDYNTWPEKYPSTGGDSGYYNVPTSQNYNDGNHMVTVFKGDYLHANYKWMLLGSLIDNFVTLAAPALDQESSSSRYIELGGTQRIVISKFQ